MNFLITGDTHRNFSRFRAIASMPASTAIIILGDVGLNYTLDKDDYDVKKELHDTYPFTFYCVRGNHEARPSDVEGMEIVWDDEVSGHVYMEKDFPRIRYFMDWGVYYIDGLRTLVVGGAYSVDKYYRLSTGRKWFENELLTPAEMAECERYVAKNPKFDLVLSHTCPRSFQPTDLFLSFIDQTTVDDSMEVWMDGLAQSMEWGLWMYGHYHRDRIEWSHVEQFYMDIEPLVDIIMRWKAYDETKRLDWWLEFSPKMTKILREAQYEL